MFIDPAGQYQFELPLGWAYDPQDSHLITVKFRRWDRRDEVVSVRAMPTFTPANASLERWHQALEDRCFPPRMRSFTKMQCGQMPAVLAEAHETKPERVHRRLLVVRGTRLDILVEHRTPELSTGPRLSDALSAIYRSLEVPSNWFLPAFVEQTDIESNLHQAQEAVQRQAWEDVRASAVHAHLGARSTYLYSIVEKKLLEVPAIILMIDALVYQARASGVLDLLRHAEHLALRSLCTVRQHLPRLPLGRMVQMIEEFLNRLKGITDLQIDIIRNLVPNFEPSQAGSLATGSGFGRARLRINALFKVAQQIDYDVDPRLAIRAFEIVIADLLTVLSTPSGLSPEKLSPDVVQMLVDAGVNTPEEQVEIAKEVVNRSPLEALRSALCQLSLLRSLTGDVVGAAKASEFAVTLARSLILPSKEQDQQRWLAVSLIRHVESLVAIEDEPSLEEAEEKLAEAEELLDRINEEGALRAQLCLLRASVLHSRRRVDNAIETIDRGLRAAAAEPEVAEETVRELKTLKSLFLLRAGRFQEARKLAAEVVQYPEGEQPRDRLRHANYYLNLAIIDREMNNPEEAAKSLREALRRVLQVKPFDEEALRILMIASQLYMERDVLLGERLNLAAAATLDVRRVGISSDEFRIGFDESTRRRAVYEDLVGRLVAFGMGKEAVAAADRSRAQSLIELLAPPALEAGQSVPSSTVPPPSLEGDDMRQALWDGAEYVIRNADLVLRQRGVVPPLHANEVEALVREIGAPALVIQPVRQQVALMLVQPSGEIVAQFSPLSLDELLELVDTVQRQFYIYSVPRGVPDREDAPDSTPESEDNKFDDALVCLWHALIEPVKDALVVDEPLLIVPYREFTLIPFALLQDPNGHRLIEYHALSVVPSLATLRALHERGPWTRTRPTRAYVVGDPACDPNFLLQRLPAACAEANAVKAILKSAGVEEENIILRLEKDAHEASYRREARDCDLVHLSCHAKLDEPAYASRLYLAPHDHTDGMLLASEVADVKLNDALVFLSACETGQGRAAADGVIGLGRAFMEAGGRAAILSLWKIEDAATSTLVGYFYRALFDDQQPRCVAEALRVAMLATRADLEAGHILGSEERPIESHPVNWAPFIVLGDGLSLSFKKGGQS